VELRVDEGDSTWVGRIEPREVPGQEDRYVAQRLGLRVDERDRDHVVLPVPASEWHDLRIGSRQIQRPGIGRRVDVAPRSFRDAEQKNDFVADPRRRGIEDRLYLKTFLLGQ
jgi:hypothetical protein